MLLLLASAAVAAETQHRVLFSAQPSSAEWAAIRKYAGPLLAKAEQAGRPATPFVARSGGSVLVSLETVALCNRRDGCPLLVFRAIDRPPVLNTMSFQNVVLEYRDKGTMLILMRDAPKTECLISGVTKARCRTAAR